MNNDFIAYVLPLITLFGLGISAVVNPNITGYVVGGDRETNDFVNATINIFTSEGVVLPADATIIVYLDDRSASMSVDRFIKLTGGRYDYRDGELPQINYSGLGYTGNHNYLLKLSDFGLGEVSFRSSHDLKVIVIYNGKVISESSDNVKRTNQ